MDKNKNVLMILYYFPPIAGSGVQRSLKFTKYLSKFGYTPIIETVKNGHNFAYDTSLFNELDKDLKVYRSNSGETLWLRNIIEKVSSALRKRTTVKDSGDSSSDSTPSISLKQRIFDFIDIKFFIPDSKIRWYRHGLKDIRKIVNNEEIHCIYSSSKPYTSHLMAMKLKKETSLPWVADFRDPWVGNVFITKDHSERRKRKEAKMEREVVKHADKVIMVTEPITEMYKKRYPEYASKFYTITNGFDGEDFSGVKAVEENRFAICYTGILTKGQSPETFLLALKRLFQENPKAKEDIYVKFIGYIVDEYKDMLLNSEINNNITILPYMTHSECIGHMKASAVNLMILEDTEESKGVFSGKIFDYIGAERPILGILPQNGVASQVINHNNIGHSYDHGDVEGVYNFIKGNYIKWKDNQDLNTKAMEKCKEFDRINLTRSLSGLFDEVIK